MTDVQITLGDLVADNPATARVLERFGLDYCCHGHQTLEAACAASGLAPADVAEALASVHASDEPSWRHLDAPELADQIVATHHAYLHAELPVLEALAVKVRDVHGTHHPELREVQRLVSAIREDLEPHLTKEERVLFPAIHALAAGHTDFPFGSVANPIRMMTMEHDRTGDLLGDLRAATGNYAAPDDACASYRSLYERLQALELDTHRHVHKENHVLFPAALQLAGS